MPTQPRYAMSQILLHWGIAVLLVVNWFLGEGMGEALHQKNTGAPVTGATVAYHVWIGMTVLALVLIRLVLRRTVGVPPAAGHGLMDRVAEWMHRALYLLMLLGPLAGAVAWFLNIESLGEPHALMMNGLLVLAGLHGAAALYHQFILKDGLLSRMRPM